MIEINHALLERKRMRGFRELANVARSSADKPVEVAHMLLAILLAWIVISPVLALLVGRELRKQSMLQSRGQLLANQPDRKIAPSASYVTLISTQR